MPPYVDCYSIRLMRNLTLTLGYSWRREISKEI